MVAVLGEIVGELVGSFLMSQLIMRVPLVVKVDCRQFSEALLRAVGGSFDGVGVGATCPAAAVEGVVPAAAAGLSAFVSLAVGRRRMGAATVAAMTTRVPAAAAVRYSSFLLPDVLGA